MNARLLPSFYKHQTLKQHIREFVWNEETAATAPDGKLMKDCDRETIRAYCACSFAKCYWPMDLVEPFVRENWCVCRATFLMSL